MPFNPPKAAMPWIGPDSGYPAETPLNPADIFSDSKDLTELTPVNLTGILNELSTATTGAAPTQDDGYNSKGSEEDLESFLTLSDSSQQLRHFLTNFDGENTSSDGLSPPRTDEAVNEVKESHGQTPPDFSTVQKSTFNALSATRLDLDIGEAMASIDAPLVTEEGVLDNMGPIESGEATLIASQSYCLDLTTTRSQADTDLSKDSQDASKAKDCSQLQDDIAQESATSTLDAERPQGSATSGLDQFVPSDDNSHAFGEKKGSDVSREVDAAAATTEDSKQHPNETKSQATSLATTGAEKRKRELDENVNEPSVEIDSNHPTNGKKRAKKSQPKPAKKQPKLGKTDGRAKTDGRTKTDGRAKGKAKSKKKTKAEARLETLWARSTLPTWVECTLCLKWRLLEHVLDPAEVPNDWTCASNDGPGTCDVPEKIWATEDEKRLVATQFTVGSVVWARLTGYPRWPALVDNDPDLNMYYWTKDEVSEEVTWYHVVFFDPKKKHVDRAWVKASSVTKFNPDMTSAPNLIRGKRVTPAVKSRLDAGLKEAKEALALPLEERRKKFCFLARSKGRRRRRIQQGPKEEDKDTSSTDGKPNSSKKANAEGDA